MFIDQKRTKVDVLEYALSHNISLSEAKEFFISKYPENEVEFFVLKK
jgi:hypothetical protein